MKFLPFLITKRKFIVLVVAAVAAGMALMVFLLKNPSNDAVAQKVSKLIEVPTDERPTIISVSDKGKLTSQLFFLNAENGDKVLIFPKSGKAILYRPSENKIVEVGVVNSDKWAPPPTRSPLSK